MAQGSTLYGVIATVSINNGLQASNVALFPNQIVDYSDGGNPEPVTAYASPAFSGSGSYSDGYSTVTGSATAWGNANNGVLTGYSSASISGSCQTCTTMIEPGGEFDVDWYDAMNVTGVPYGTPVDLLLTVSLDSYITESQLSVGAVATMQATLGNQNVSVQNLRAGSNGLFSESATVQTFSGATISLSSGLAGTENVYDGVTSQSGAVDAGDTANTYIAVVTPGASYTAASGASYAQPSSAPEPANFWITVIGLLVIVGILRRRATSAPQPVRWG